MINVEENKSKNEELKNLYMEKKDELLKLWESCFIGEKAPKSINEFGIIDIEKYDTDNGILVIGKETRGWDLSWGYTFIEWLHFMAIQNINLDDKYKTKRPKMWYNIGRWAKLINEPSLDINSLASEKTEALSGLSYIAFTNINKVGGGSTSKGSFKKLSEEPLVKEIIQKEIEIIRPKYIVLCGIEKEYLDNTDKKIKIIEMPHPSAMKSTEKMLKQLKEQLSE